MKTVVCAILSILFVAGCNDSSPNSSNVEKGQLKTAEDNAAKLQASLNTCNEEKVQHQQTLYYWYEGLDPKTPVKPDELKFPNAEDVLLTAARVVGIERKVVRPFNPKVVRDDYVLVIYPPPNLVKNVTLPRQDGGVSEETDPDATTGNTGDSIAELPIKLAIKINSNKFIFVYKPPGQTAFIVNGTREKETLLRFYQRNFMSLYKDYKKLNK